MTTLRRTEMELDEADEMVRFYLCFFKAITEIIDPSRSPKWKSKSKTSLNLSDLNTKPAFDPLGTI
jgi:hypothetical protein